MARGKRASAARTEVAVALFSMNLHLVNSPVLVSCINVQLTAVLSCAHVHVVRCNYGYVVLQRACDMSMSMWMCNSVLYYQRY